MQRKAWALLGAIGLALGAAAPALAGTDPVELVGIIVEGGSDAVIALAKELSDLAIGATASVGDQAFGALAMVLVNVGSLGTALLDDLAALVMTIPGTVQGPVDLARDTTDGAFEEANAAVQQVAAEEQALGEQLIALDQEAQRLANAELELVPPYVARTGERGVRGLTVVLTPIPDVIVESFDGFPEPPLPAVDFVVDVSGDAASMVEQVLAQAPDPAPMAEAMAAWAGLVVEHAQGVPPTLDAYAQGAVGDSLPIAEEQVEDTGATAQAAVGILTS